MLYIKDRNKIANGQYLGISFSVIKSIQGQAIVVVLVF